MNELLVRDGPTAEGVNNDIAKYKPVNVCLRRSQSTIFYGYQQVESSRAKSHLWPILVYTSLHTAVSL